MRAGAADLREPGSQLRLDALPGGAVLILATNSQKSFDRTALLMCRSSNRRHAAVDRADQLLWRAYTAVPWQLGAPFSVASYIFSVRQPRVEVYSAQRDAVGR